MNLDELLPQKLAEWRFDNNRQTLTVTSPESGWAVDVTAACSDAVGCKLWDVALRPLAPKVGLDLKAHAERLAGRVTGLLEPLKLIEVDAVRRTAQLRSEEPAQRGDELHYYELLLDGDGAALVRRYRAGRAGTPRREQEAFTLTHEALAKLVRDLTAQ
jgi:hypothetical protein